MLIRIFRCPSVTSLPPLPQAMLGIFFTTHSAVLIEDVPVTDDSIYQDGNPQRIYAMYNSVGYNCFIAAAIYILFGAFSTCQMKLNKQKEYLVH
ncbi:ribonuclease kappa-A-like isoform X2 [Anarrhichthys ocellatus]|uniref:ribonuclease kappa-A-like isoform X2 n=1 Tax=Anarrhichthys ocellatus TaxID=433405 RepID=UPI0012EEAAA5|nr:ribonuclease kappa-A-like isoform X2 [Anarrhichthys ocellatus]